jgi:hypothetical protein
MGHAATLFDDPSEPRKGRLMGGKSTKPAFIPLVRRENAS